MLVCSNTLRHKNLGEFSLFSCLGVFEVPVPVLEGVGLGPAVLGCMGVGRCEGVFVGVHGGGWLEVCVVGHGEDRCGLPRWLFV